MFMQAEADRLVQAATAALASGLVGQAAKLLQEAIHADPNHPMVLTKQAELAMQRKDHVRALLLTDAALAIEPNFAPAWNQRASACWAAGQQSEAVKAARQALEIQPPNPEFRLRFAQFAAWSGDGAATRSALVPLLEAGQDDKALYADKMHYADKFIHARAISLLGELAISEGRFEEANGYLDRALDLHPKLDVAMMQRGMNRLRLGQFRAGWADYAARERIPELHPDGMPMLAEQAWQGQSLAGKSLVVIDDQGHGDAIQFFRYLPLLRDRGAAHVTWRTFPPLVRLLGRAAPYATVLDALPSDARFDFQCSSTSLPRWFETERISIPVDDPYLRPRPRVASGTKRPAGRPAEGKRLKVGLAWSGDARHTRDHLRSIPASQFLGLADVPSITFHSLQHEVRASDLPALTGRPAIGRQVEKAADLADTAALIAKLDLVITVDTVIAHLAGALGKPVWIVLHVAPDWRWLTDCSDSPWYPTARLFRVTPHEWLGAARSRDPDGGSQARWGPALGRVSTALRAFAAG